MPDLFCYGGRLLQRGRQKVSKIENFTLAKLEIEKVKSQSIFGGDFDCKISKVCIASSANDVRIPPRSNT